jgi:predicted transcriptional regulator
MRFHELFDLKPIKHAPINRTTHLLDDKEENSKKYDGTIRNQIVELLKDVGPMATFEVSDVLKCNIRTAKIALNSLDRENVVRALPRHARNVPKVWEAL